MKSLELAREETHNDAGIGQAGRVVLALALSGGLLLGGVAIAAVTLMGRMSAYGLLESSTGLYILGVALGLAHAIPLGLLGRDEGRSLGEALRQERRALLYTVALVGFGWPVAGWIALTIGARHLAEPSVVALAVAGWLIALVSFVVSGRIVLGALRRAYLRWPERRVGSLLIVTTFLALLLQLVGDRPEIWGSRLRLNPLGGVLVSFFCTLWIVAPLVTVSLRLLRHPNFHLRFGFGDDARAIRNNVLMALVVGVLLALLVLPFHLSPLRVPVAAAAASTWGMLVLAASRALLDEVFLRVAISGLLAALIVRWHLAGGWSSVAIAVLVAAGIQAALYMPGIAELGLRNGATSVSYTLTAVLLPALVLGVLFWKRGFTTALLANAVSLVVVGLAIV